MYAFDASLWIDVHWAHQRSGDYAAMWNEAQRETVFFSRRFIGRPFEQRRILAADEENWTGDREEFLDNEGIHNSERQSGFGARENGPARAPIE
ncbi:MAG: hypothetical protein NTY38_28495 [Acidobacteria bacterium]|nr:hypothetical protein [Acidobacteriota bacterium]